VIKKININMDSVLTGYGVVCFFYFRKSPPVNLAPQVTLRDLDPAGTGSQRKPQHATGTVHNRAAA